MKKLSDFETLEAAQEYSEISTRVLSADMMRPIMLKRGLYGYFLEGTSDYLLATMHNMQAGGEFNFIKGHPKYIGDLLGYMIHIEKDVVYKAQLQLLMDDCHDYCNFEVKPFKDSTKSEFDKARKYAELHGVQEVNTVLYQGGADKHVKLDRETVRLMVILEKPVEVDTTVTFKLLIRNSEVHDFAELQNWSFQIIVPKGSITAAREITNTKQLTRHVQFSASADIINPFHVEVTGV